MRHPALFLLMILAMRLAAAEPMPATEADYEAAVASACAGMKWLEEPERVDLQRQAALLIQRLFPSAGAGNDDVAKSNHFRDHLPAYVSLAELGADPDPRVRRKERLAYLQAQFACGIAVHLSAKPRSKDEIARRAARLAGLGKVYAERLRQVLPGLVEVAAEVPERTASERISRLSASLGDYFQILGSLIDDRRIAEQEQGQLPEVPLRFKALLEQWWQKLADKALPADDRITAREQYIQAATQEAGWQCDGFTTALILQDEAAVVAVVSGITLGELRQLSDARNQAMVALTASPGRGQPRR